jgi:predicted DNA-binding transcriptional regulator AlpA
MAIRIPIQSSSRVLTQLRRTVDKPFPDTLKQFDELPASGYVRMPVVQGLYACSPATVWRKVKAGELPAPIKLSANITAWNVGMLRADLAAKTTLGMEVGSYDQ